MNRTRLAWIGVALLVLIGVGLWATSRPSGEFSGLDVRLAAAADEAGHGGRITLRDSTDFGWDEAHIFDAYTPAAEIESDLDGRSPLSPGGRLVDGNLFLANDGIQLVAFRRDDEVVAWTVINQHQLSQTYIAFESGVFPRVVIPSNDGFIVQEYSPEGWLLLSDDHAMGET